MRIIAVLSIATHTVLAQWMEISAAVFELALGPKRTVLNMRRVGGKLLDLNGLFGLLDMSFVFIVFGL